MKVLRGVGFFLAAFLVLLIELGCGDQYRPVANPIVGPGGQPAATHYAYVVNNNPTGSGTTTQINVSGDTNMGVTTMGVGAGYEAFLYPSKGALFVTNSGNDSVTYFVPAVTSNPVTINLLPGSHPVYLTSTESGVMYVLNSGPNAVCDHTGSISTISTTSLSVTSTVCVGVNPIAMAEQPGINRIYVLNQGDNGGAGSISIYDPPTQSIVFTITSAQGLAPNPIFVTTSTDGNYVFVISQGDGVSPGFLNILVSYGGGVSAVQPLGVSPNFAFVDPNLNRLYVTNTGSNTVSVFDISSVNVQASPPITLLGTTNVGSAPVGVTALANGTQFYVANSGSNDVSIASATSFKLLKTLAVGQNPVFIASDPTSSKVYVNNKGSSSTTIINTTNNTVTLSISAPPQVANCTSSCALQEPLMTLTQ